MKTTHAWPLNRYTTTNQKTPNLMAPNIFSSDNSGCPGKSTHGKDSWFDTISTGWTEDLKSIHTVDVQNLADQLHLGKTSHIAFSPSVV